MRAKESVRDTLAGLPPEAQRRFFDFLDAVDDYVEERPPTGSLRSVIEEVLESIEAMPSQQREPLQRFLNALDERFGGSRNLKA